MYVDVLVVLVEWCWSGVSLSPRIRHGEWTVNFVEVWNIAIAVSSVFKVTIVGECPLTNFEAMCLRSEISLSPRSEVQNEVQSGMSLSPSGTGDVLQHDSELV